MDRKDKKHGAEKRPAPATPKQGCGAIGAPPPIPPASAATHPFLSTQWPNRANPHLRL